MPSFDTFFDFCSEDSIAAIALTPTGVRTLQRLVPSISLTISIPSALAKSLRVEQSSLSRSVQIFEEPLKIYLAHLWTTHRAIIFAMATGAVVRLIAPLLDSKAKDPAILVMDDGGNTIISLCGGHQRGADRLAHHLALCLNGSAIITGASNQLGLAGVDVLGLPFGWQKGAGDWTGVSAAIARQETVLVVQEAGSQIWQQHLPAGHTFQVVCEDVSSTILSHGTSTAENGLPKQATPTLWISPIERFFSGSNQNTEGITQVQWHPRVLWVGIGCERNTPRHVIEQGIRQTFQATHYSEQSIAGIATIDLKADEVGLVELCRERHWPLRCFPANELRSVAVPTPSSIVEREVGTPSVSEAAALLAAALPLSSLNTLTSNVNLSDLDQSNSSSKTLNAPCLRVSKQIFRFEEQPGAITVAIAQSSQEYVGRNGGILIVGTGPGKIDQMTSAAQGAIAQADAVIGYGLYLDLLKPLLRPGQIVEAFPITQERQRADRAICLADWGLTVAVISSGDAGIYGMAGLVMERLSQLQWDGKVPGIKIFPGVSALQSAAACVGAPLMHDFCAISLSDLLTPWEMIEKRLHAAAEADFVISIYNPKSKTRIEQIAIAQSILLKYKPPQTPVAIVRSAYRADEKVTLSTLENFLEIPIDMLTLVLIGNATTFRNHQWLITPRGYLEKL